MFISFFSSHSCETSGSSCNDNWINSKNERTGCDFVHSAHTSQNSENQNSGNLIEFWYPWLCAHRFAIHYWREQTLNERAGPRKTLQTLSSRTNAPTPSAIHSNEYGKSNGKFWTESIRQIEISATKLSFVSCYRIDRTFDNDFRAKSFRVSCVVLALSAFEINCINSLESFKPFQVEWSWDEASEFNEPEHKLSLLLSQWERFARARMCHSLRS